MASARDLLLARRAKKAGANYSLRIIWEARRAGIPISAGFALVEQESNFRNVFGHDPVRSIPVSWRGTSVTRDKYLRYKANRKAGLGMQGVGPVQLTWYEFQDRADRLGGCWIPRHNIRVGFEEFAKRFKVCRHRGFNTRGSVRYAGRDYNGSGPAAEAYGRELLNKYDHWHRILAG